MASNEREELEKGIRKLIKLTEPFIQFAAIHSMPWEYGDITSDFMQLIDKYCEERERVARIDELKFILLVDDEYRRILGDGNSYIKIERLQLEKRIAEFQSKENK